MLFLFFDLLIFHSSSDFSFFWTLTSKNPGPSAPLSSLFLGYQLPDPSPQVVGGEGSGSWHPSPRAVATWGAAGPGR